jgi:hypothetical protein
VKNLATVTNEILYLLLDLHVMSVLMLDEVTVPPKCLFAERTLDRGIARVGVGMFCELLFCYKCFVTYGALVRLDTKMSFYV